MTTARDVIAKIVEEQLRLLGLARDDATIIGCAMSIADAVTTQAPDSSYVIVPKKPTMRMMQDGYIAFSRANKTQIYGEAIADRMYRAMIAAAPAQPPEDVDR